MNQNQKAINRREFRKLEDLNLIDNFLFQQMLLQGDDGEEFARILLSTFLERPIRKVRIVPQKQILGVDTNHHGIRMDAYIEDVSDTDNSELSDAELVSDIYDIEPNRTYEKDSLPKRMRYYHGLIDSQLLNAGSGYDKLPNVVILIILPYDPFDKNRMVYTISNHCEEDISVTYNDGAKKIFLYTKGIEGSPSQEIKDMLKYIQESTKENVTNKDIASIQQMVDKVKHKKEVGINYMKSWEYEKMITDEAREYGYNEGFNIGHNEGFNDGFNTGHDKGFNDGFNDGFSDGFNNGISNGTEKMGQLILRLTEAGRTEDIEKAARDANYREHLFKEFEL